MITLAYSPWYRREMEQKQEASEWAFQEVAPLFVPVVVAGANENVDEWLIEKLIDAGASEDEIAALDREQLMQIFENDLGERPLIYDEFPKQLCRNMEIYAEISRDAADVIDNLGVKTSVWELGEVTDFEGWPDEDE